MDEHFEFLKYTFSVYSLTSIHTELQQYGNEGWEPHKIGANHVLLRRPVGGVPQDWEIHTFDDTFGSHCDMPEPAWCNHLASCGWVLLEPSLSAYGVSPFHLAKREGKWRGTDDGDVLRRLADLGYNFYHCQGDCNVVSEVLEAKWMESEKKGHNVGTYEAVKYWLAERLLRQLLTESGASLGGRSPQAVLEEVLNLRSVLHVSDFKKAVEFWSRCEVSE